MDKRNEARHAECHGCGEKWELPTSYAREYDLGNEVVWLCHPCRGLDRHAAATPS